VTAFVMSDITHIHTQRVGGGGDRTVSSLSANSSQSQLQRPALVPAVQEERGVPRSQYLNPFWASNVWHSHHFVPPSVRIWSIAISVPLRCISQKPDAQTIPAQCMLPVAVPPPSFGGVAIRTCISSSWTHNATALQTTRKPRMLKTTEQRRGRCLCYTVQTNAMNRARGDATGD